ncbi:MAG: hypothetical protein JRJ87_11055 [Deltaproteobacteria bacterium]|nr:hypothetical protein [Deltaproteobacteria bacterium]
MKLKDLLWAAWLLSFIFCVFAASATADDKKSDAAAGAAVELRFDKDKLKEVPPGVTIKATNAKGEPARWEVVAAPDAPSKPNAFGITANKNRGRTYNLALVTKSSFEDVDISVKVKAVRGVVDQGGGPVWRARDENNYYIARWNPLEDNFRVYYVKNGQRRQLKSARTRLDSKVWHTIRVVMRSANIECYLDGKKLLVVSDKTFKEAGKVGLWVKADGQTLFDDLTAGLPK